MTNEQRMTASIYAAQDAVRKRKGLGRWPVTEDMVQQRKELLEKAKEEARTKRKIQAAAREREKAAAKKEGRRARRKVDTTPIPIEYLGGRIRHARMKKGLGQSEFAAKHGFHRALISQWERGCSVPKTETIERLAEALGVSSKWLKEGRGGE